MVRLFASVAAIGVALVIVSEGYTRFQFYALSPYYERHGDGDSGIPSGGAVPDKRTAVGVAIAVLKPVYGENLISSEMPFYAELRGDRWIVRGTLWCFPLCFGGTAVIEISKTDGRILYMTHEK